MTICPAPSGLTFRRAARKLTLASLFFGGILFAAAGRLDWTMGWIFWGTLTACMISTTLMLAKRYPELLAERLSIRPGIKKWDLYLASATAVWIPLTTIAVGALDFRWGWTQPYSGAVQAAGLLFLLSGDLIVLWAMYRNPFFSAVVRIQTDRNHHVVTGGPYRWIRHPGYLGAMLYVISIPLILNSLWAWIPVAVIEILTLVRTVLEDRTLQRELPGYAQYAREVPYRLLPSVW
ncbi:MAG: isoprenylcysteine carboxylmethyltransferase family protein [Acidobacteria bacterium]|nr:isoprenylcysteine carboxylmethyltransferase family protein [Acidobacteriota bacterium]